MPAPTCRRSHLSGLLRRRTLSMSGILPSNAATDWSWSADVILICNLVDQEIAARVERLLMPYFAQQQLKAEHVSDGSKAVLAPTYAYVRISSVNRHSGAEPELRKCATSGPSDVSSRRHPSRGWSSLRLTCPRAVRTMMALSSATLSRLSNCPQIDSAY